MYVSTRNSKTMAPIRVGLGNILETHAMIQKHWCNEKVKWVFRRLFCSADFTRPLQYFTHWPSLVLHNIIQVECLAAKINAIYSDIHQLQLIKLHQFQLKVVNRYGDFLGTRTFHMKAIVFPQVSVRREN